MLSSAYRRLPRAVRSKGCRARAAIGVAVMLVAAVTGAQVRPVLAETLSEAIALAYDTNPNLLASRAQLQAVDEGYVAARAGMRPTLTAQAAGGYTKGPQSSIFGGNVQVESNTGRALVELSQAIYHDAYWLPIQGDRLPSPLALLVFDAAVNCGVSRAIMWLQEAAGCTVDGKAGPQTVAAVNSRKAAGAALCAEFQALRLTWMVNLPAWRVFGLGWARRLCRLPYLSLNYGDS